MQIMFGQILVVAQMIIKLQSGQAFTSLDTITLNLKLQNCVLILFFISIEPLMTVSAGLTAAVDELE